MQEAQSIAAQTLTVEDSNLISILDTHGVAIVPLKNITTEERNRTLGQVEFYKNANQI